MSHTKEQKVDPTPALKKQKVDPAPPIRQTFNVPSLDDTHHSTHTGRTTQVSPQNAGEACYEASREGKNGKLHLVDPSGKALCFEVTLQMRLEALRSAKLKRATMAHDYLSRQQELLQVKLLHLAEARIGSILQKKSDHEPTSSEIDTGKKTETLCREVAGLRAEFEQLKALKQAPGEIHILAKTGEHVVVKIEQVSLVEGGDQQELLVLMPRTIHARLGKYEENNHDKIVYLFDPCTHKLCKSTTMKTPLYTNLYAAEIFFTGQICVGGGRRVTCVERTISDFQVFQRKSGSPENESLYWSSPLDPNSNWSSFQEPRSEGKLVKVDNLLLFVLGGRDNEGQLVPTVERLNPAQNVWEKVSELPHVMCKRNQGDTINAVGLRGKIYVLEAAQGSLCVYDPVTKRWTELKKVPFSKLSRSRVTMCVAGNRIFFGNDSFVYFYNIISKEYGTLTPPQVKQGTTLAAYAGVVMRIGGEGAWSFYCETTKKWEVLERDVPDFLGSCQIVKVSPADL